MLNATFHVTLFHFFQMIQHFSYYFQAYSLMFQVKSMFIKSNYHIKVFNNANMSIQKHINFLKTVTK